MVSLMCLMPLLGQWGQWAADRAPVFSFIVWHLPVTLTRQPLPPVGKLNIFTWQLASKGARAEATRRVKAGPRIAQHPFATSHPIEGERNLTLNDGKSTCTCRMGGVARGHLD